MRANIMVWAIRVIAIMIFLIFSVYIWHLISPHYLRWIEPSNIKFIGNMLFLLVFGLGILWIVNNRPSS
jgi:uncharacterized membrane protein YphA (DoxX/SURF4 family)